MDKKVSLSANLGDDPERSGKAVASRLTGSKDAL